MLPSIMAAIGGPNLALFSDICAAICSRPFKGQCFHQGFLSLFDPCLDHVLQSTVNVIFFLWFSIVAIRKSFRCANVHSEVRTSDRSVLVSKEQLFYVCQFVTSLLCLLHSSILIWHLFKLQYQKSQIPFYMVLWSITQAATWLISFLVLQYEYRHSISVRALPLTIWWAVSFIFSILNLVSFVIHKRFTFGALVDIFSSIFTTLMTLLLICIAWNQTSSMGMVEGNPTLTEPLVISGHAIQRNLYSTYASAGYASKALFLWLDSLLECGSKRALQINDIPALAQEDHAESLFRTFQENLSKQPLKKSIPRALARSHWSLLACTGLFSFIKLSLMYVGPLMIQSFIDFATTKDASWAIGLRLVLILFFAKVIEQLTERQRSFLCWRLSLVIKSSLIAAVFQKSLHLSNAARQDHGSGQIVNYMSVDVEEVSNFMINVHNLWILPLQIGLALAILFKIIGISTVAGLATMIMVMCICLLIASQQRKAWRKIMACKDERIKVTNEAINNMKIIKMQSWQDWFLAKIEETRGMEQVWARKLMYIAAISIFFLWLSPNAVSVMTFGACILSGTELTASRAFTAIATFRILQEPLRAFPQIIMAAAQAAVSLSRLQKYLESSDIDSTIVERLPAGESIAVVIESASFKWEEEQEMATLKDINISIPSGSVVTIVGAVGSGKSALLACILGEMQKLSGKVRVSGNVAYVAQAPWIQNGTIQENILFGKSFKHDVYNETLRACSLISDLHQFEHGDQTEIGERGINLSGGQKQRVQLARAVYQNADVYLLDDIFSAVDAHTGSALFMECIRGALRGRTVLLVTHQVEFLHGADLILVMRDGKIVQSGTYEQLLQHGLDFGALVVAHNQALETINVTGESDIEVAKPTGAIVAVCTEPSNKPLIKCQSINSEGKVAKAAPHFIEEEERATGHVNKIVYWAYATKVFNGLHILLLLLIQSAWQGLQIESDFWLANSTSDTNRVRPQKFISVYAGLAFGSGLFVLLRTILIAFCGLLIAQRFYLSMLRSIFSAPMSFFDATPTGRILTRSSTDQVTLDFTLPFLYGSTLATAFQLIGVILVISKITWQLILVIVPLTWIYISYQRYFISTSRELTRLKSITEAPIIQHFKETIAGIVTIRAFRYQEHFSQVNFQRVNTNVSMTFHNAACNEWLSFRLEFIGIIILCSSASLLVLLPKGSISPEYVGLSLSYGLAISACLNFMIFCYCQVEQNMVAVERILQYTSIPSEQPESTKDNQPPDSWPHQGTISVESLQLRYRPESPLVLKGISFRLEGGEKLGVVGRTGSGKSSLIQALFRLVEPAGGRIMVDNIDISSICLKSLRSRLSIIPQDPTLFEGTVRTNLDPLNIYSEQELWEALRKCQLIDTVNSKGEKLEYPVADNGENWSMGQRQLLCLGRVLLKHSRILVLDEATASIDTQTDWILQKIMKEEFSDCTVISIAHRIPSVMDSDKVLVLDSGEAKEFGAPLELLASQASLFSSLVQEYWNRSRSTQNLAEMDC